MEDRKISIVTLGCSKNDIDSELMSSMLKDSGFDQAAYLEEAEIIIVNTCGFIESAKEESIETIWEMTRFKEEGKCQYLILAGCLAQRYSDELLEEIEDIDAIIGTGNIKNIVSIVEDLDRDKKKIKSVDNINEDYLEDVKRLNFNHSEYVKISEGCDNHCTYCIIPKLRGTHRSRKMENIIEEVKHLVAHGVKEVILIGQNTSDYGIDLYGEYMLYKLLDELETIEGLEWVRLLYLYPDNFDDKLIKSIRENKKVVKYVDIPLQHISNNVLKMMNRRTNKEDIINLIQKLRRTIPGIVIRTTFIVGFPGETQEDFKELYDFIQDIRFERLGVFTYSKEEGTPAYNLEGHLSEDLKEERRSEIMELQRNISEEIMSEKVGKEYKLIIEEDNGDGNYIGRSYMDSPEIDGVVYIETDRDLSPGDFVQVRIKDYLEYDLLGEVIDEFSQ